jgi:hypothetical protein
MARNTETAQSNSTNQTGPPTRPIEAWISNNATERTMQAARFAGHFVEAAVHHVGVLSLGVVLGLGANAVLKKEGLTPDAVPNFSSVVTDPVATTTVDCNNYPSDQADVSMSPDYALTQTFGTVKKYVPTIDQSVQYTILEDGVQITTDRLQAAVLPMHGAPYAKQFTPESPQQSITLSDGSTVRFGPASDALEAGDRIQVHIACPDAE